MSTSAASLALKMQKIASDAQVNVQKIANEATSKSFDFNAREAATSRTWQKEMSDTSHQREVADLKKAGLNPILSAGGSGAQSYTTSSASAQAADPSSAVSNIASSRMGAAAQGFAAEQSANAMRASAAQQAAATRYAAAQQASAQRYAAAMAYQTQKDSWKWKTDYMNKEYENKIKLVNSTPTSSVGGVLDKIAQRAGLYDLVGTRAVRSVVSSFKSFLEKDPSRYFANNGNVTKNNFQLNKPGKAFINQQLQKMGISTTGTTRNLLVRAVAFNDWRAAVQLAYYVPRRSSSSRPMKYRGYTLR